MPDNELNPVLGIDLGTTFSAIARWDGRGPRVYLGRTGKQELQSAVYYNPKTAEFLVGQLAFSKGIVFPENLALGIKRHMDDAEHRIVIAGKEFTPVQLSSKILERLYCDVAEQFPKGRFKSRGTVVTVPYYFKAHQCENTRKAAQDAKIECSGILQEPVAASLAYAWQLVQDHPEREAEENILVFDLGGGTFDLTLFRLGQTKKKLTFEVLATGGDDRLGGMDFDERMAELVLKKAGMSLEGLSPVDSRKARQKLIGQSMETKEASSFVDEYSVAIPFIIGDKSIETMVTRVEFANCIEPYVKKIEGIIDAIWATAGLRASDIHRVIRVGGSSLIPRMKQLLDETIGEEKVFKDPEPSLAVVKGAAIYAAHIDDPTVLGREVEITTRTCHALGVEVEGGQFSAVIPANRKAPCTVEECYTNTIDGMKALHLNVFQGSKPLVSDNTKIGTINIPDLPPRKKGSLDIEVTFDISPDQNLSVTVKICETVKDKRQVLKTTTGAFTYA